jgi:hypothetical protein
MHFRRVIFVILLSLILGQTVLSQEASNQVDLSVNAVTVEWSPDGSLIAVGTEIGVKLYNANLEEIGVLPDYSQQVVSLSWSPDSQQLAGVGYPYEAGMEIWIPVFTSSLLIWERNENDSFLLIHQFDYADQKNVVDVEWSPNGGYLAARTSENIERTDFAYGDIEIWDTKTWEIQSRLQGTFREMLSDLAWSPDSALLASSGEARCDEIRPCNAIDETITGMIVFTINPSTGQRVSYTFSGAYTFGVSWSLNNQIAIASTTIRIYDSNLSTLIRETVDYDEYRLAWMPNQTELLLWSFSGKIDIVDSLNFESRFHLELPEMEALSLSPDGRSLAIIDTAQTLSLYDIPPQDD